MQETLPETHPQNMGCCAPPYADKSPTRDRLNDAQNSSAMTSTTQPSEGSRDQRDHNDDFVSIAHNQIGSRSVSTHVAGQSIDNAENHQADSITQPKQCDIFPSPCAELQRNMEPFQREYFDLLLQVVNKEYAHLQEQQRLLDLKRKERIFIGSLVRDFDVKQAEGVYHREREQAESEHLSEKNSLKERMIAELNDRKQRALEDKDYLEWVDRNAAPGIVAFDFDKGTYLPGAGYEYPIAGNGRGPMGSVLPQRKSRRRAELEQKARRKNTMDALMRAQLPEHEIMEDLFLIFGEGYTATSSKRKAAKSTTAQAAAYADGGYNYLVYMKEYDDSISYDGITYRKGDDVVVEKEDQDDVIGEIVSVSNNDIWVRSAHDGSRFKVSIAQLRLGKTFISHIGSR